MDRVKIKLGTYFASFMCYVSQKLYLLNEMNDRHIITNCTVLISSFLVGWVYILQNKIVKGMHFKLDLFIYLFVYLNLYLLLADR